MGRYDALTKLDETPEKASPPPVVPVPKLPKQKTDLLANQDTNQIGKTPVAQPHSPRRALGTRPATSPPPSTDNTLDTSFLTTKEKTKYGTYLTDESIEKISIRAIQLKRDAHQIVQEAVNQYFEKLEK